MVAVDGSKASERACEWAIQHLCRSGDLLHIVHVETMGATLYSGPPDPTGVVDPQIGQTVDLIPPMNPPNTPYEKKSRSDTTEQPLHELWCHDDWLPGSLDCKTGRRDVSEGVGDGVESTLSSPRTSRKHAAGLYDDAWAPKAFLQVRVRVCCSS